MKGEINMRKQTRMVVSVLTVIALMLGMTAFSLTANAAGVTINATDVTIYALDERYAGKISIPDELPRSFQLAVKGASNVKYSTSGDINCSKTGLITPFVETWYWFGSVGSNIPPGDGSTPTRIERSVKFGTFSVYVNADGVRYTVNVTVKNYADKYVDDVTNEYIIKNIKTSMKTYDKLVKVAKFIADIDYDYHYQSVNDMIILGGGDCWASTNVAIYFAKKLGFEAWVRNGNKDPGAGSGHRNALVYDGSKYYEVEAGYGGTAPRGYEVVERTSLLCFSYNYSYGGYEVYQYDGKKPVDTLEIPSEYNGKPVTSIGDSAFSGDETISNIVLPNTIVNISNAAFFNMKNLKTINIPASVKSMGYNPFRGDSQLKRINSQNAAYKFMGGILIKDNNTLVAAPNVSYVGLGYNIKKIESYALWHNNNITAIDIPDSVETMGEAALAGAPNLEKVYLREGKLKTLPKAMLYNTNVTELYIPDTVTGFDENFNLKTSLKTIKGYTGSAAESFASDNGLTFVALNDKLLRGDANLDGEVDIIDASVIQRFLVNMKNLEDVAYRNADANNDGSVDIIDATTIQRYLAGFITSLN